MQLSPAKLRTYQKYYGLVLTPLREFSIDPSHPVTLMQVTFSDNARGDGSWKELMCPCALAWKWKRNTKTQERTMVHVGSPFTCVHREAAREVVHMELRNEYLHPWMGMTLVEAVSDVWKRHQAGVYMGEHNTGSLYVQDVEKLLGTIPQHISYKMGAEVVKVSYPSAAILAAVEELKKQKILDLSGMVLVPYVESFRFPAYMHRQFAYWIEEPLGWPNGDAGEIFLWSKVYKPMSDLAGWKSGEDVFGHENIPELTPHWKSVFTSKWIPMLNPMLGKTGDIPPSEMISLITIEEWIVWLTKIRDEIHAVSIAK